MNLQQKLINLDTILSGMNPLVIAFSGGVDSSFLLYRASLIKDLKVMAVTVKTPYIPARETIEAIEFCKKFNIEHHIMNFDLFQTISHNPPDRCYWCKKHLFSKILEFARMNNFKYVADGSNYDDLNSYRPGLKALSELSVRSPLFEADFTKEDIRNILKEDGITIWDKPSMSCLLTRLPYNTDFTEKELRMVDKAEDFLFEKGFYGTRVRIHGDIARIECLPGFIDKFINSSERDIIVKKFKEIGFRYISLDLEGYRSGSMDLT
ncbi:MAG: ATP-dependent sacrificial sulfur transferase LarE [Bacteroidales bacterium]